MLIKPINIKQIHINKPNIHKSQITSNINITKDKQTNIPADLMGAYTFSFKAKTQKGKEKQEKQALYKQLLKSGCSEKDAKKVLCDEGVLKRFRQLSERNERGEFSKKLGAKDILTFALQNYKEKEITKYIELTEKKPEDVKPFSRNLNRKELLTAVENNFSNEEIQRYIKLRTTDEEGNTYLSRALTPAESTHVVAYKFSDNQAQAYIKMRDLKHNNLHYSAIKELLNSDEKCKNLLVLTTENNGFSRKLDDYSAMLATVYEFSKEDIQRQIELEDKNANTLTQDEVSDIIQADFDDKEVERYIEQRKKLENELKAPSEFWAKRQAKTCAFDIVKHDLNEPQTHYYLKLQDVVNNQKAIEYIKNPEILERLEELFAFNKEEDKEDFFCPREIISILENKFDDDQAILYREIHRTNTREATALDCVRNKKTVERYKELTNQNSSFSRPLTSQEAANLITHKIEDDKIEEFINLSDKQVEMQHIVVLLNFFEFKDTKSINNLSLNQKRNFIKKLVEQSSFLMYTEVPKNIYPIVPKNANDFSQLLAKLAKQIGISSKKLTEAERNECLNRIKTLQENIKDINLEDIKTELKYPQKDFISDIEYITENLNEEAKNKLTEKFKFSIQNGKLIGYPTPYNGEKNGIEKEINELVIEYSKNNEIKIINGEIIEKDFNAIINTFPELKSIVGKEQHNGHSYTLDIHSLKVLKNIVKNPEFKNLSEKDKRVLTISSLLHDITKEEGKKDKQHPIESAFESYYIIQKLNLNEDEQRKIYELVKTHDWLEKINTSEYYEEAIKDYAFTLRHSNIFELAKIFCKADIEAIRNDCNLFDYFEDAYTEISKDVDLKITELQETQIILPQSIIPQASEIIGAEMKTADNITNTVLYMDKLDNDLSQYGFEKGTTKENFRALVHALDAKTQLDIFSTFSAIDSEALLSTSYISPENYKVFRKQGLLLDVNYNDIHAGYNRDFGSGFKKTINELKSKYLFPEKEERNNWRDRTIYRRFISDLIKRKIGITNQEYAEFINTIQDCKSLADIKSKNEEYANLIQEALDEMEPTARAYGRKYNEMLITRPRIQGVFSYSQPYEKIPLFLREYAQENNLPIIMFDA